MKKISNKQKVLKEIPNAYAEKDSYGSFHRIWASNGHDKDIIGIGLTEEYAWEDAVQQLHL